MLDFLADHQQHAQIACAAIAATVLVPLVVLKSVRAYAWTVRRSRELHGEICECVYCDQLTELRRRIEALEEEVAELRNAPDSDREWPSFAVTAAKSIA